MKSRRQRRGQHRGRSLGPASAAIKSTDPGSLARINRARDPRPFRLIDEGPGYVVVDKPSDMMVHPSKPDDPPTMWDGLRRMLCYEMVNGGQISIITRLDRDTSGVVLVATHRRMARTLGLAMQRRELHKTYWAIAHGWPEADEWQVDAPIVRQGDVERSDVYVRRIVHPQGQDSSTRFRVIHRFLGQTGGAKDERLCWLRATPFTGRMHQIRVHLLHSGHAMVGDKLYGRDPLAYITIMRKGWTEGMQRDLLLRRQALHACELDWHPADNTGGTGARVHQHWHSPMPPDLLEFLRQQGVDPDQIDSSGTSNAPLDPEAGPLSNGQTTSPAKK